MKVEGTIKYALGYYDAVITHLKDENEIPGSIESISKLIRQIADESSLFEDAVFEIGVSNLAERILKGGE